MITKVTGFAYRTASVNAELGDSDERFVAAQMLIRKFSRLPRGRDDGPNH